MREPRYSILADIQDAIERAKQGKLALYWQRTIQREYRCKKVTLMSRTFTNKTDESTLTTLCPRCLNAFRNARGIRVRRADPYQLTKEPCTYCQTNFGYDYYIQPTSPKSTYTKKGRFDDELICA